MEKNRKMRLGHVISNKMDKTVVVTVETVRSHPRYRRVIRQASKFKAHDEENACQVGDLVRIVESRPLSKDKKWRVIEIISRKEEAETPINTIDEEIVIEEKDDSAPN